MIRLPRTYRWLMAVWILAAPGLSSADLIELTVVERPELYDDLERASARANQAVFDALDPICGERLSCDVPSSLSAEDRASVQSIYEEARELVDTADDILSPGSGAFGLGLDDEGLGNALRWTAAEEVQAQARAATDFSNGQTATARNRITALRYGARGFSIAGLEGLPTHDFPTLPQAASLGAAGDAEAPSLTKLGGFLNGSYGWGTNDPTTFEDAFDYESVDVTVGVDYRIRPDTVVGLIAGYAENTVDFDGSKSIVDGGIDSDGFSLGAFGVYTMRDFYVSGFFSYQRMEFDMDRFITYPSLNPDVPGTNTRTKGDTDSDAFSTALNLGYTLRFGLGDALGTFSTGKPFLFEPSLRLEYTHITINDFTETNVDPDEYFALRIQEQDIESLELALGGRLSIAVSTPVGVFFPYFRVEWRFELDQDDRTASSEYSATALLRAAGGPEVSIPFLLSSEKIDSDYGTLTVGLQTIVRGGRSRLLGGPTGDRLSLFAEYRRIVDLENIESQILNAGIRYLF